MSKGQIPAMPPELTWTESQWKAIWAEGQDILVAAAAGSGKTAVLVNRIINKIISNEMNVDELLVVTFTNAAAAEMRHRIADALDKEIKKNAESQHLRRQLSLLNKASISTLHSFCLDVIRKYYYEIDIDPGFRIADSTEAELLKDEVLDDLLEEQYAIAGNDPFFRLVDAFSNDRNDIELQNIIRTLDNFSSSHPYPENWLDSMVDMYDLQEGAVIDELPFYPSLQFYIQLQLSEARACIENALEVTKIPGGPAPHAEILVKDLTLLETLEAAFTQSWSALYEAMGSYKFATLKAVKGDEYDKDLIEQSKELRKQAKDAVDGLKKELFSRKPESYLHDMKELKGYVAMLAELVKDFKQRYAAEKREKSIVDFSDLEHYCLQILTGTDSDGNIIPSQIAENYRSQFKEVLVDEYQDVNSVQETLLNLVSKPEPAEGNRFMVGDVKQSIYRFRLAEPNLFLGKHMTYRHDGAAGGLRIDLNKNFRSRKEVLDATNYLFKQLMGVTVGEIVYDDDAELKLGAPYPQDEAFPVEILLIDRDQSEGSKGMPEEQEEELEKAQLEARLLAQSVKEMIHEKRKITDTKTGLERLITYRDIVILMRSMTWAPEVMEEFKKQGIPVYGNLASGYFEATEVAVMMSLLKVIDNPLQDIPLASVLRSPIVGLDEEQMAAVRTYGKGNSYFEALQSFCKEGKTEINGEFYVNVHTFYEMLGVWRELARQHSVADLIWQLYRDTKYYDYVGGMPGGKQRQANLRALYDRARQYEESSFRGLFRFLRFIERMQDRGNDLGTARALSEQEDVVRIMTIHSSKGLEFPVVFVSGIARQFNMMDLYKSYLLDKEYGFACKYTNPDLRITYPSLPQIAFKRKKQLELIAEEMRVLYVALTRAKEKLILIGSIKNKDKTLKKWRTSLHHPVWLLPEHLRASAKSYSDWIGPALARHRDNADFFEGAAHTGVDQSIVRHPSSWKMSIIEATALKATVDEEENEQDMMDALRNFQAVHIESDFAGQIKEQLSWKYGRHAAANHLSKQTVTELKRQVEVQERENAFQIMKPVKKIHERPAFMQAKSITGAERGTITHLVMQQANVRDDMTEEKIISLIHRLVEEEFLTAEQAEAVNVDEIAAFFETDLAKRMKQSQKIQREVPFSLMLPAQEAYSDWDGPDELVMVQGIIDCLFTDEEGTVLLDYKTDRITDRFPDGFGQAKPILEKRYAVQIDLYTRAVEEILNIQLNGRYLYFFDDGGHVLEM
ncbi:helicase-exonuclease AddAB subunit AddA [Bacillus sp. 1P06AnD]|uniref:helicase-exonuclease AddAB subunit AddA n=1 Tax=Bacillus sp. 1P06AnD TaxID=3132208 RepID=UPI0039A25C45